MKQITATVQVRYERIEFLRIEDHDAGRLFQIVHEPNGSVWAYLRDAAGLVLARRELEKWW